MNLPWFEGVFFFLIPQVSWSEVQLPSYLSLNLIEDLTKHNKALNNPGS